MGFLSRENSSLEGLLSGEIFCLERVSSPDSYFLLQICSEGASCLEGLLS